MLPRLLSPVLALLLTISTIGLPLERASRSDCGCAGNPTGECCCGSDRFAGCCHGKQAELSDETDPKGCCGTTSLKGRSRETASCCGKATRPPADNRPYCDRSPNSASDEPGVQDSDSPGPSVGSRCGCRGDLGTFLILLDPCMLEQSPEIAGPLLMDRFSERPVQLESRRANIDPPPPRTSGV